MMCIYFSLHVADHWCIGLDNKRTIFFNAH